MKKNKLFLMGMAALVLALAGCPTDGGGPGGGPDGSLNNPITQAETGLDINGTGVFQTLSDKISAAGKYVILDLSACTADGNTIAGSFDETDATINNIISGNEYIKGIILPNTLTSIGFMAFVNCTSLTSVTIPNSVTSIGVGAFDSCTSLTSVTIPNSVTSIAPEAFAYCTSLTSVTIPNSVTSIGKGAFGGCSSLAGITVDTKNTSYSSVAGVLCTKDGKTLIAYPGGKEGKSYTIPNSVTSIGGQAFLDCASLTSVTIPNGVTSIGGQAFYGCTSLTSVTIPNSVTSIEMMAFVNCTSLASVTIPSSVTSIGGQAFYGCTSLTSVTFATGSNISEANFDLYAFPKGASGAGGDSLKTAYSTGKAGTYTRAANGDTWTKSP